MRQKPNELKGAEAVELNKSNLENNFDLILINQAKIIYWYKKQIGNVKTKINLFANKYKNKSEMVYKTLKC